MEEEEEEEGREESNPIPLDPPVTRAVIPCKDHLLAMFGSAMSPQTWKTMTSQWLVFININ